ncbi:DMT family transporter [Amylibacter sp.]|nr:DMT family transporter [Amylibacter sp.]MDA9301853.1 DMT family transporter [Amylibacter sp.]
MNSTSSPLSTLGVLCALLASFAFTLNDVGIKFLSGDYPLHQIVLVRAFVAMFITLIIIIPFEGGYHLLRTKQLKLHLLRGAFVVLANILFFLGLAEIPLSEATAIFFVSPLIITLFSVIFLLEKVGPWRWFAVIMGLVGAIVMLRPTSNSFQLAGLLPIGAAFCYASLHILTRKMGTIEKASTMSFYLQLTFVVVSISMGLVFGDGRYGIQESAALEFLLRPWVWPNHFDLIVMACIGVASAIGGYTISQAYRLSEAALIAPIEYVALILAVFWGIAIFNEWPDSIAWTGIALILFSGLLMLWRESIAKKITKKHGPLRTHR